MCHNLTGCVSSAKSLRQHAGRFRSAGQRRFCSGCPVCQSDAGEHLPQIAVILPACSLAAALCSRNIAATGRHLCAPPHKPRACCKPAARSGTAGPHLALLGSAPVSSTHTMGHTKRGIGGGLGCTREQRGRRVACHCFRSRSIAGMVSLLSALVRRSRMQHLTPRRCVIPPASTAAATTRAKGSLIRYALL